jgi:hypothetical protein
MFNVHTLAASNTYVTIAFLDRVHSLLFHLQSEDPCKNLVLYVDDAIIHSHKYTTYLATLRKFFSDYQGRSTTHQPQKINVRKTKHSVPRI